jgi:hypothetical protein
MKIHPATKKYNQYNEICKTKSLNNTTHTLRNPPRHVRNSDGGGGGGKGVKKDRKGMLITEKYKNVHNGHGHGVSREKPHE